MPTQDATPEALIAGAPNESQQLLRQLAAEPLRPISELAGLLNDYESRLADAQRESEFLDLATAQRIGAQCRALLKLPELETDDERRRIVQLAIRYFVVADDGENDIDSPIGFDDDAAVVAVAARLLDREDLLQANAG